MSLIPNAQEINITYSTTTIVNSFGSWENIATPGVNQGINASPGTTIASFTGQTAGGGSPAILLTAGNTFVLPLSGVYRFCFSLQLTQGAGNQSIKCWLASGGIPIPDTASLQYIQANTQSVIQIEILYTAIALQTVQLVLQSSGVNSGILTVASTISAPQSPAIIMNIQYLGT